MTDKDILGTSFKQPHLTTQPSPDELQAQSEIYNVAYEPEEEEPGLSKAQMLYDLIRQLRSGKDLYRISLPAALLAPVSMLEYVSNFVTPNEIILNVNKENDPCDRFITVVKWWLSNMTKIPKEGILHAKPYNPILGEVFRCKWIHSDSKTHYLAEQVSHHPPISAAYASNPEKGFSVSATLHPKSKFHGNSASTIIDGEVSLTLHNFDEVYKIEFPTVLARGLIWSTQCLEVYDHMKVSCEKTGFSADIYFPTKSNNSCKGDILFNDRKIFTIDGCITDTVNIKNNSVGEKKILFKASALETALRYVPDLHEQMTIESRRVWHKLTYVIMTRDYAQANGIKNEIEEEQRELRKLSDIEKWKERYFKSDDKKKWVYEHYTASDQRLVDLEQFCLWEPTDSEIRFIEHHYPNHSHLQGKSNGADEELENASPASVDRNESSASPSTD